MAMSPPKDFTAAQKKLCPVSLDLIIMKLSLHMSQWRIQEGAPTPKIAIIFQIFDENCMKMKEFGPPGGGGARPWRPP